MQTEAANQPYWDESRKERRFTLGLDLGQAADYSALALVEKYQQPLREIDRHGNQTTEVRYEVRFLSRYPLGTSYTSVVEHVAMLLRSQELLQWVQVKDHDGHRVPKLIRPSLVIDATGVGRPIADLFRKAGLDPVGVVIHGGDTIIRDHPFWRVPKRDLVGQLQVVFQNRTLKIAQSLPLAGVLAEELRTFTRKINIATAHESFEHWRDSQHDDLVLSVALAYWWSVEQGRHTTAMSVLKGF
jgi:hypothetical protein